MVKSKKISTRQFKILVILCDGFLACCFYVQIYIILLCKFYYGIIKNIRCNHNILI
jgi:hypothetical protein